MRSPRGTEYRQKRPGGAPGSYGAAMPPVVFFLVIHVCPVVCGVVDVIDVVRLGVLLKNLQSSHHGDFVADARLLRKTEMGGELEHFPVCIQNRSIERLVARAPGRGAQLLQKRVA